MELILSAAKGGNGNVAKEALFVLHHFAMCKEGVAHLLHQPTLPELLQTLSQINDGSEGSYCANSLLCILAHGDKVSYSQETVLS